MDPRELAQQTAEACIRHGLHQDFSFQEFHHAQLQGATVDLAPDPFLTIHELEKLGYRLGDSDLNLLPHPLGFFLERGFTPFFPPPGFPALFLFATFACFLLGLQIGNILEGQSKLRREIVDLRCQQRQLDWQEAINNFQFSKGKNLEKVLKWEGIPRSRELSQCPLGNPYEIGSFTDSKLMVDRSAPRESRRTVFFDPPIRCPNHPSPWSTGAGKSRNGP